MAMTERAHDETILSVIRAMRAHLTAGLTLNEMADIACLSPFHFHRQFQRCMGVSPGHFFTSLRMDAAKSLLLTTTESVVDICFAVGYSSPGTFTTRFAQLVGETPTVFRELPRVCAEADLWMTGRHLAASENPPGCRMGTIIGPEHFAGLLFVGAFSKRIPQGMPLAGVLLDRPCEFAFPAIADGQYHILVAAIPDHQPQSLLLAGDGLLVGIGTQRLQIVQGCPVTPVNVVLRQRIETDPPILVALPMLLRRQVKSYLSATR